MSPNELRDLKKCIIDSEASSDSDSGDVLGAFRSEAGAPQYSM